MDLTLIWKTVLIGVVEGLTEFLPVSSTGHIILAEEVLNFQGPPGKVFEIVIQLGAILAVCVLYRAKILATVGGVLRRERPAVRFAAAIVVAFLPAAVIGVIAHDAIKSILFNPWIVAVALIVGGIAILVIERLAQRPRIKSLDEVDLKTALFIGICQCLAMIPGVSRSGSTIMGARVFRVDRATAAEFSFFLAMPTMLGATVYDLGLERQRPDRHRLFHSLRVCSADRPSLRALHQPPRFRRLRLVPHCAGCIGACPARHALML